MSIKIRKARTEDVKGFMDVKNQLPFKYTDGRKTTTGGFLLGTNEETYLNYIQNDYCLVAEDNEQIIGFGIVLKDESVRKSDVWERRNEASWTIDIEAYEDEKICYFEQLAFLKGHSRQVLKLAYHLVCFAFQKGHNHLFTTTVKFPITNLAAVPYILKASGNKVGEIDENYPIIGRIQSDIYLINVKEYFSTIENSAFYPFFQQNMIDFK